MYKLIGHSLQRGTWFEPESQSMTLIERNSNSSITLGPDAPEIGFNDWLLDDGWPEGPTIWRVKGIDNQTDTETVTVSLEHVIRTLEDPKLFEDVETGDIAGGETCTSRQAIEYLLARQNDWVLGDCDGAVSLPYEFSGGDSLLDAIESVSDTIEDAEWWYDLSRYPFVLNIRKRNGTAVCEMRGGRNVSTLRRSINRSGMYTRIWPVGKNDLHISGDYISRNENIYGRIDKIETNEGKTGEDSLRAWANGLLRKHCEPTVTITISGLEMSQDTGESLDWIQLNRVCRCPLPEFNTTILERVIKIAWRDRKKDPEAVTVTLGNSTADVRDLTKTVEETSKSGGRGARGQAKQNYLFEANGEHLLYEVFDECGHLHGILRMTEQSLRVAFENLNECTRSEFYMTSESLRVQFENEINSTRSEFQMTSESLRVTFENEIASTRSQMEMTSESLRTQFENEINSTRSEFQMTSESLRVTFENEINSTRSQIEVTSESLRTQFENEINSTRSEFQMTSESLRVTFENEINSTRSQIEQTADKVSIVVDGNGNIKAASIVASINNATKESSVLISADRVSLSGNTTVEDSMTIENGALLVKKAAVFGTTAGRQVSINNGSVNASTLQVNSGGKLVIVGSATGEHYDITSSVIQGIIKSASVSGNVLTLTPFYGNPITFSKATSLSGEWSGDSYVVTAKQNGATVATHTFNPPMRLNGTTAASNFSAEIYETPSGGTPVARKSVYGYLIPGGSGSGSYVDVNTQYDGSGSSVARISVGSVYTDGVSSVKVIFDTSNKTVVPSTSSSAVDSIAISLNTGSLSGSGTARKRTVKALAGSYTAQSAEITDYGDGYGAGRDAVIINKGSWSGGQVQFSKNIGSGTSKGVRVGLTGSWSGTNYNYTIKDYYDSTSGVSTGYKGTINAYSVYEDGMYDAYGNMTFTEQPNNKQIIVKLKGTQLDTISTSATWWAGYSAGQSGSGSWQDGYDAGYAAAYGVGETEIDGAYTGMIDKRAGSSAISGLKNFGGLQCPTADSWAIVNIMVRSTTVRGYISMTAASQASYQSGYDDGYAAGYNVTTGQISVGNVQSIGTDSGGRASAGSISKSKLAARSYLGFSVNVHGTQKLYYITVND